MVQTALAVTAHLETDLHRSAGLTPFEFHLLAVLGCQGPDLPMSAAAHYVDSSLSRLSHVVRRLEERGWVTRRTSPEDARVSLVTVTPVGMERLENARGPYRRITREVFLDAFTAEELEQYTRLTLRLLAGLREGHWLLNEERWPQEAREEVAVDGSVGDSSGGPGGASESDD
ncbi:MarR family winged helix-turn-helix transcriptional regulator [Micrococcus sp.]|uniref:MarR family winged helix-turn-helix transcriptional regulator n=1 Tax=Micrococcus sp. TaxID=1271 RepID=UPI002A9208F6|nr:MarR family transcriptional regulator [Micrococcus sp.]MDY6054877.1 MarR family transcriptional regulator [Micrococcus sp.]